jgi:hypothetical protein
MEDIGTVIAILSDRYLLVQTDKLLSPDTVLTAFGRISPEKLKEVVDLTHLDFPKGKIRVVSRQNANTYLAERFRNISEKRHHIPSPGNLLSEILQGRDEVIEVAGPWSAEFDVSNKLKIEIDRRIKPGDFIAWD